MLALCIESSNSRGMGHLFRSFLYVEYLKKKQIDFIYLINDDEKSLRLLQEKQIEYILVDYADIGSEWEKQIIHQYQVDVWFNDKFETSYEMGQHIKEAKQDILFCMLDDVGNADVWADIVFAGMIYPTKKTFKSRYVYAGPEYIILNPQIAGYRRKRTAISRIIVTLGGSDPHGVTLEVTEKLKTISCDVDIIIGPNFKFKKELEQINQETFRIYQNVPSLIEMFYEYDLAITGGGVTCCEANAAGLPCVIIANAPHEINTGEFIQSLGSSIYAGKYGEWDRDILDELSSLDVATMSESGMKAFRLDAVDTMFGCMLDFKNGERK